MVELISAWFIRIFLRKTFPQNRNSKRVGKLKDDQFWKFQWDKNFYSSEAFWLAKFWYKTEPQSTAYHSTVSKASSMKTGNLKSLDWISSEFLNFPEFLAADTLGKKAKERVQVEAL